MVAFFIHKIKKVRKRIRITRISAEAKSYNQIAQKSREEFI